MATRPDLTLAHDAPVTRVIPPDQATLAGLLQYEGDLRRQATVNELVYFVANETKRVVAHDQLFVLKRAPLGEGFRVIGVSSLATVDRNAPLIHGVESAINRLAREADAGNAQGLGASTWSDDPSLAEYPFPNWHWQPLQDRAGTTFGGLLVARSEPLGNAEAFRLTRIGETVAHGWCALTGNKPARKLPKITPRQRRWLIAGGIILALFPVRLSALAPVEVVAARPFVISAPYPAVIARIEVAPNAPVAAGQPVLTFEDIKVRNEMQQAGERLRVAKAKIERATSAAFVKAEEAREIGAMRAEYDVALADYRYARDMMAKSQLVAPVGGMAIYSDRRDWEGRAVNAGDPVLQIADPKAVAFRIDLPTKEQMSLRPGDSVKVWLDAQPLWSIGGRIEQASYISRPTADGVLAFAVIAKPEGAPPRIGSRGTAKLYGQWVPLSYALFKRPISSVRQYLGL